MRNTITQSKTLHPELASQSSFLIKATQPLGVPAKRVLLMLIAQINPKQQNNSLELTILADDYRRLTGVTGGMAYEDLKAGAKELRQTDLEFKDDRWTAVTGIIERFKYEEGEAELKATFPKELKPHLFNLVKKGYAQMLLSDVMTMRSMHSIRVFELLMMWKETGLYIVDVTQFREVLAIEDKYLAFSDLRKYVIEKSIGEINEKSRYTASYKLIKKGRKVSKIHFHFKIKDEFSPGLIAKNKSDKKDEEATAAAVAAIMAGFTDEEKLDMKEREELEKHGQGRIFEHEP